MDLFKYIISREKEGGKHGSDPCIGQCRVSIGDFLKDCLFRRKDLMLLIIISDLYPGTEDDSSSILREIFIDDL